MKSGRQQLRAGVLPAHQGLGAEHRGPPRSISVGRRRRSRGQSSPRRKSLITFRRRTEWLGQGRRRGPWSPWPLLSRVHRHVGAPQQRPVDRHRRSGKREMPMLAPTSSVISSTRPAAARRPSAARAIASQRTPGRPVRSPGSTANSSPPRRATRPRVGPLRQPRPQIAQQGVAEVVAERVVDLLEAVEVEQHHGEVSRRARADSISLVKRHGTARGWRGRSVRRSWPSRCNSSPRFLDLRSSAI